MTIATLRTGDTKTYKNEGYVNKDDKWGVLFGDKSLNGYPNRFEAREERSYWGDTAEASRLVKILKVTPKTVTVEITK